MEKTEKKPQDMRLVIKVVGIALVLLFVAVAIAAGKSNEKKSEDEAWVDEHQIVTEEQAYDVCSEKAILSKLKPDNVLATHTSDLDRKYINTYWKDKDGKPIYTVSWNGYDKDKGANERFYCDLSGTDKDNLTIHHLSFSSVDLIGEFPYDAYDDDGNLLDFND